VPRNSLPVFRCLPWLPSLGLESRLTLIPL
jgi:hypothetical protein